MLCSGWLKARATRAAVLVCVLGVASSCDESPTSATPGGDSGSSGSSARRLASTRFLAFGDSMTAGEVTAPAGAGLVPMVVVPAASFPTQLQSLLRSRYSSQAGEIAVANAGRSSELLAGALPRLADLLANTSPQVLLLFHGSEDLLNFGDGGVNPGAISYDRLAAEGRRRGARVFIALLPPSIAGRQRSVPDSAIRAFNERLYAIAQGERAVVVDLYAALASDVGRYIGPDGLHPNEAGYRRIADEFLAKVIAEIEQR